MLDKKNITTQLNKAQTGSQGEQTSGSQHGSGWRNFCRHFLLNLSAFAHEPEGGFTAPLGLQGKDLSLRGPSTGP